jgi:hypothetical protein
MNLRFDLLILGIILFGVLHWIFHKRLFPALERRDIFDIGFYVIVLSGLFVPAFELTMVGLGYYQNQYTGSRIFKGILY